MGDDPTLEAITAAAEADLDGDDWELYVREAELRELVAIHQTLTTIVEGIEGEFAYRVSEDEQLAAGSDADRSYAEEHSERRFE